MVLNDLVDPFCYSQKNAGLKGLIARLQYICVTQGPISQIWWFCGNMSSHIGNYIQWFMFVLCIYITVFVSAFLIIRRQVYGYAELRLIRSLNCYTLSEKSFHL